MNQAVIRIIAYSFIALLLLILLLVMLKTNWINRLFSFQDFSVGGVNYANADEYSVGNTEVDSAQVTMLNVDWISGRVDIITYDGTKIVVEEANSASLPEEKRLHYWLNDGTLNIKFCASGLNRIKFESDQKKLQIKVPKAHAAYLKINSVSADIAITDVLAIDAELKTVSGNITGTIGGNVGFLKAGTVSGNMEVSCTADKAELTSVSGDLDFTGSATTVDAKTTSGEMRIDTANSPKSIKAKSVSGSIKLLLPDTSEFEAKLGTVSGTLRCEFPTVMLKKNHIKCGNGGIDINTSTVSGDLEIKKR